jgi:GNAT superfamily N-acetyltransferase
VAFVSSDRCRLTFAPRVLRHFTAELEPLQPASRTSRDRARTGSAGWWWAQAQRSGGVGAALVAAAEEWARVKSCARLRVRSNVVRERTHRFYERLGYRVVKSLKVFDKVW